MKLSNPEKIVLGKAELAVIKTASDLLANGIPMPDNDAQKNLFVGKALEVKESLGNLKSRVSYTYKEFWPDVVDAEMSAKSNLMDEFTKTEANLYFVNDSSYKEKKKLYDAMTSLEVRINSLEWDIRQAIQYLIGK